MRRQDEVPACVCFLAFPQTVLNKQDLARINQLSPRNAILSQCRQPLRSTRWISSRRLVGITVKQINVAMLVDGHQSRRFFYIDTYKKFTLLRKYIDISARLHDPLPIADQVIYPPIMPDKTARKLGIEVHRDFGIAFDLFYFCFWGYYFLWNILFDHSVSNARLIPQWSARLIPHLFSVRSV